MTLENLIHQLQKIKKRQERRLKDDEDSFDPEVRIGTYGGGSSQIDEVYIDDDKTVIIY